MIGPREADRADVDDVMSASGSARTAEDIDRSIAMENATVDAAARTAQREATVARLTEIADQINAGHVPAGVRVGPAEIGEPEAGA
jgi:hypothetical protein